MMAIRSVLRSSVATLAACCLLLVAAASAQAAPGVTLGGTPALNQTSGTFTFGADGPALRLECSLDGFPFSACSSPLPVSGLTVAAHTFSVRAIGLDNSVGAPTTYNWTIDMTRPDPPVLTTPIDNLLTRNPTPTFGGTAEPLARVLLYDGSNQIASPEVDAAGHWSYTPGAALDEGTHSWRARTLDPSGNRSDYSATRALRIDTIAPGTPVIAAPTAGAHVNTRTPQFAGTADEPQVTISVSEGATRLCSTAADPAGEWSCTSTVSLGDGAHTLTVVARDAAGNESAAATRSFDLDATPPPAPSIASPADGLITTAAQLTLVGTASPLSTVKIFTGSDEMTEVTADLNGDWEATFDPVSEDDYTFTAREVDDFSNRSPASNLVHVRVDRTPPLAGFQTRPPAKSNQANAAFVLSSSEGGATFECALDGDDWQPCAATPEFPGLTEGTHTLKIRATDTAGNTSGAATYSWLVDLTPPTVPSVDAPADAATLTNARPTFSGHAEPSVNVEVFISGVSVGTAPSASIGGAWALTPGAPLAQGVLQVQVRAIDPAGNVSAKSAVRLLRIDSVAPTTTITGSTASPTNAQTFSAAFISDDALSSSACSIDTGAFVPCTSPYTSPVLAEGSHTFRVRSSDPAGNVESPAKSLTIVVDRTPPTVESFLIDGSAGSDGIPAFQIASNDAAASGRCKLDNAAFVACSGRFKPAGATSGVHALTIRFTDPAGNSDDQVIAFSVTPTPATNPYVPPAPEAPCTILGAPGSTTGRVTLTKISGKGRNLKLSAAVSAAAIARVDVTSAGRTLASTAFALRSGTNKLTLKLKSAVAKGRAFEAAARFYTVKREYGTARIAGTAAGAGYARSAGAQSRLETACLAASGASSKAKLALSGASAGRKVTVTARGRQPALVALKVYRAGGSVPVADGVLAIGPAPAQLKLKLISGVKLARGGYRFTFDAIAAGGRQSSGRGAFLVH